MSKSTNIKLFTEILELCNYNEQNDETKRRLQTALSYLLKQAQDRCVSEMLKARTTAQDKCVSRNGLKEEARCLMHREMQKLITSRAFMESCRKIVRECQAISPNKDCPQAEDRRTSTVSLSDSSSTQRLAAQRKAKKKPGRRAVRLKSPTIVMTETAVDSVLQLSPANATGSKITTKVSIRSNQSTSSMARNRPPARCPMLDSTGSDSMAKKKSATLQTSISSISKSPLPSACHSHASLSSGHSLNRCAAGSTRSTSPCPVIYEVNAARKTPPPAPPPTANDITNFSAKIHAKIESNQEALPSDLSSNNQDPPKNSESERISPVSKKIPCKKDKRMKIPPKPQHTSQSPVNIHGQANTKSTSQVRISVSKHSRKTSRDSLHSQHSVQSCKAIRQNSIPHIHSKCCIPTNLFSTLRNPQIQRFQRIVEFVDMAIRNRKTFTILGYSLVRRFLYNRGWVERLNTNRLSMEVQQQADKMQMFQLINLLDDKTYGYVYSRMLKSKLLGNNPCDLIWDPRPITYSIIKGVKKPIYLNHYRKRGEADFCSKIGLCRNMRNLRWNYRPGLADVRFPRTYLLCDHEMEDFVYDFRITACLGLVKWFVDRAHTTQVLISKDGHVPVDAFFFAILQCIGYIKHCKDIEYKLSYSQPTWSNFIDHYHRCVYLGEHFTSSEDDNIPDMIQQATEVLNRVRQFRPELDSEGTYNIWILKPDQHSRGNGIHVCRKMCQIKELVAHNIHLKYLIQKYIEKPLIIYNTKFDIRQWFLVSTTMPLTVWMYTECYLRFSSQHYDLKRFHESIHLTNNSVQCRYKNASRNSNLPNDNMWDSNKFNSYLNNIGHPEAWSKIIYPKMKQAVMAVLLSAKDDMEMRPYSFELYGADFMVTSDFQPWLIEINSHPALSPSTSVTARLCPQVIEDVIRVVIDKAKVPSSSSGKFELIFKDPIPKMPLLPEEGLFLYGTPLSLQYYKLIDESLSHSRPMEIDRDISFPNLRKKIKTFVAPSDDTDSPATASEGDEEVAANLERSVTVEYTIETTRKIVHMKSILKSLLDLLNKERQKRLTEVQSSTGTHKGRMINVEDVANAVSDIQSTIEVLSKGEVIGENRSIHGMLAHKTCLLPKTLTNIITILTMGLYGRNKELF